MDKFAMCCFLAGKKYDDEGEEDLKEDRQLKYETIPVDQDIIEGWTDPQKKIEGIIALDCQNIKFDIFEVLGRNDIFVLKISVSAKQSMEKSYKLVHRLVTIEGFASGNHLGFYRTIKEGEKNLIFKSRKSAKSSEFACLTNQISDPAILAHVSVDDSVKDGIIRIKGNILENDVLISLSPLPEEDSNSQQQSQQQIPLVNLVNISSL